jgi:hypothetical protein
MKTLSGTATLTLLAMTSAHAQATAMDASAPANHWRHAPLRPDNAWSLEQPATARSLNLNVTDTNDRVEYITVIGKRRVARPRDPESENAPVTLGPATISSTMDTRLPGRNVLTVTAAVPIGAIPGVDAVANMTGVSDRSGLRDDPFPIVSEGPPLGLRIKF